MECAARGMLSSSSESTGCLGPSTRRCGVCGAVAYCSPEHQISHWRIHKDECGRLKKQMELMDVLLDFPLAFSMEVSSKYTTKCSFLKARGLHKSGFWKSECGCESQVDLCSEWRTTQWFLPEELCPCTRPSSYSVKVLSGWKEYYEWRHLQFYSPVAMLLHWPLTMYYGIQITAGRVPSESDEALHIHYLGPEKELCQLQTFKELLALVPGEVHIELIGPAVPESRDGEQILLSNDLQCLDLDCLCKSRIEDNSSRLKIRFWKGFYHDRFNDISKDSFPHYIIALNAGVAAYSSWIPTIQLIRELKVPVIFSDYCEEAAYLAGSCIESVFGNPLTLPIQINPFRQPFMAENAALYIPCYSNCFLFGMC